MGGVFFCKKVENGGVDKKWKMVFFVKKWTFPQRRVHYVQYQYFLFYIILLIRGAYAPNAPPLPVWARGQCRISPPRFLAECCKRQLNQVSLVLLYFRLSAFSDLY